MTRKLGAMAAVAMAGLLAANAARAEDPMAKLPGDTLVYARLDAGQALAQLEKYLQFLDPERTTRIVAQVKELHACLKVLAEQQQFNPKLLDKLDALKIHFALVALPEPKVTTHTYKSPKWDPKTGDAIPGQFEERTSTSTESVQWALIVEAEPDLAADFFTQFKAMLLREEEKKHAKESEFKVVDVDQGEMIENGSGREVLGRLNGWIVFSDGKPDVIWQSLAGTAKDPLSENGFYKRFIGAGNPPFAFVLVNIASLLRMAENEMKADRDRMAREANASPERLKSAETDLAMFRRIVKLFSLDRLPMAGAKVFISTEGETATADLVAAVQVDEPIGPALKAVLNGGRKFEVPPVSRKDGITMMFRFGHKEIYDALVAEFSQDYQPIITMMQAQAQSMTGEPVPNILDKLAGDLYLSLGFTMKDAQRPDYSKWKPDGDKEPPTRTVKEPTPEFTVLVGLKDREASAAVLAKVFANLATNQLSSSMVKKKAYMETDVWVIGPEKADDAPGEMTMAVAIVGRHLAGGTWNDVTKLIRQARAAEAAAPDENLARIMTENKESNLIAVIPAEMVGKFQEMAKEMGAALSKEDWEKTADDLASDLEDKGLAKRVSTALKAFFAELEGFQKDLGKRPQSGLVTGTLNNGLYEIRLTGQAQK